MRTPYSARCPKTTEAASETLHLLDERADLEPGVHARAGAAAVAMPTDEFGLAA